MTINKAIYIRILESFEVKNIIKIKIVFKQFFDEYLKRKNR